jgi:hypothetical protein
MDFDDLESLICFLNYNLEVGGNTLKLGDKPLLFVAPVV